MSTGPTRSDRTDQSSLKSGPPASHPAEVGSGVLDLSVSTARPVQLDRTDRIGSDRTDRIGQIGLTGTHWSSSD